MRSSIVCDESNDLPMDGKATFATDRLRLATAATRISAPNTALALRGLPAAGPLLLVLTCEPPCWSQSGRVMSGGLTGAHEPNVPVDNALQENCKKGRNGWADSRPIIETAGSAAAVQPAVLRIRERSQTVGLPVGHSPARVLRTFRSHSDPLPAPAQPARSGGRRGLRFDGGIVRLLADQRPATRGPRASAARDNRVAAAPARPGFLDGQ